MENNKHEKIDFNEMPKAEDEQLWQQFGDELWRMLKQDETAADTKQTPDRPAHLPFARLDELARRAEAITPPEAEHLADCRYCERRFEKLRELAPPLTGGAELLDNSGLLPVILEPKRSFWTRAKDFFRFANRAAARPAIALASIIGFLILAGLIFRIGFSQSPTANETAVKMPNAYVQNGNAKNILTDREAISAAGSNQNSANINSPNNLTPHLNRTETTLRPTSSGDELAGVPSSERAAVVAGARSAFVPIPEDLRLFQTAPVIRGANPIRGATAASARPLSPVNRAVREASPVFRWQAVKNAGYSVVITDRARREVANSGVLKQNSWRISKELPPGFYFWTITAQNAEGAEITSAARPALFKVINEAEKSSLEKVDRQVKSNFAKAVIYFRAGLFDEAERELAIELKRQPNSRRARNLSRRIREFTDKSAKP